MNESSVGIYNVALKIATLTSITLIAINSIGAPKFAEFYAKRDIVGLQRIVNQINRLVFWTSLPILLISVLFPEFILSIFGNEFKIAAWSLIILCIGQFINAASGLSLSTLALPFRVTYIVSAALPALPAPAPGAGGMDRIARCRRPGV